MGENISGKPTQANLDKLANYSSRNSFYASESRKQSKRDLDSHREVPDNEKSLKIP